MWSVGCIFGELLGGKPMFQGTSTVNQIDLIVHTVGKPSASDLAEMNSPYASSLLQSIRMRAQRPLSAMYPDVCTPFFQMKFDAI